MSRVQPVSSHFHFQTQWAGRLNKRRERERVQHIQRQCVQWSLWWWYSSRWHENLRLHMHAYDGECVSSEERQTARMWILDRKFNSQLADHKFTGFPYMSKRENIYIYTIVEIRWQISPVLTRSRIDYSNWVDLCSSIAQQQNYIYWIIINVWNSLKWNSLQFLYNIDTLWGLLNAIFI